MTVGRDVTAISICCRSGNLKCVFILYVFGNQWRLKDTAITTTKCTAFGHNIDDVQHHAANRICTISNKVHYKVVARRFSEPI